MNTELRRLLREHAGVIARAAVLARVEHHVLDHAVRYAHLARPYPTVYVDPALVRQREAILRAALVYADGRAAVSHTTALELWRLPAPATGPIHLITDGRRHLRGAPGLIVHRREGFELQPPGVVHRGGTPVTSLERTVIDSWPLLDHDAKRAPAIFAVNGRMTTPPRLVNALTEAPRLAGRRHLARLLQMLAIGCRSQLEIWGYLSVFRGSTFQGLRRQVPVAIAGRTIYLDLLDDIAMVNFELEGAKYHAGEHREGDLRRDALLAARGVTVVRFTHNQLVYTPDEVRARAADILRVHRRRAA